MPTDERRRVLKVFVVAGNRITLLIERINSEGNVAQSLSSLSTSFQ
jgi:hypothetical protein